MKSIESTIVEAASLRDFETIQKVYVESINAKNKLDRWFTKYIDMFDEKLSNADKSDPVKKLYDTKFNEYSKIARVIKVAEHYMGQK